MAYPQHPKMPCPVTRHLRDPQPWPTTYHTPKCPVQSYTILETLSHVVPTIPKNAFSSQTPHEWPLFQEISKKSHFILIFSPQYNSHDFAMIASGWYAFSHYSETRRGCYLNQGSKLGGAGSQGLPWMLLRLPQIYAGSPNMYYLTYRILLWGSWRCNWAPWKKS